MTIYNHVPYTYLVGWSKHNLWYYGVRYAKNCHPDDLWIIYYTSSKRVCQLRAELGEPDIVQVRKVFMDAKSAIRWEEKVLRKMNVLNNPKWINANISGAIYLDEKARAAISSKAKDRKLSDSHKQRISDSLTGKKKPNTSNYKGQQFAAWRQTLLPEEKKSYYEKIVEGRKNSPGYEDSLKRQAVTASTTWRAKTDYIETVKVRQREVIQNMETVICPHCSKAGKKHIMARWHFDNCKSREPI